MTSCSGKNSRNTDRKIPCVRMMLSAAAGPWTTDPVCIGRHKLRAYRAEAQARLWRIRGVADVVVFAHISSIYPYVRTVVMNNLAVANRMYVSNLAGLSHRAAIPEAHRPQRPPHTDLYATASVLGVPHFPLVLRALLRLVEHRMIRGR